MGARDTGQTKVTVHHVIFLFLSYHWGCGRHYPKSTSRQALGSTHSKGGEARVCFEHQFWNWSRV